MSTVGWSVLGSYLLGYLLCWRTVVWALLSDITRGGEPEGGDVAFVVGLGSLGNTLWPMIAVGILVRAIYRGREQSALYAVMPRRVQLERKLRDRERAIAKLERELGIGREPPRPEAARAAMSINSSRAERLQADVDAEWAKIANAGTTVDEATEALLRVNAILARHDFCPCGHEFTLGSD